MEKKTPVLVKVAAAVLLVFAVVSIVNLSIKFNDLKNERDSLQAQLDKEKLELEELIAEYEHDIDEDYVKKIARDELGYHYPDEIIYQNDLNK